MTTFKNNAKYAELLLTYLDVAFREDTPLEVPEVLEKFEWRFKGGSLEEASQKTRLKPVVSGHVYPSGLSGDIAKEWPDGRNAQALAALLVSRKSSIRLRNRGMLSRISTYQVLTSSYGQTLPSLKIYSGMKSVYHLFGLVWEWAAKARPHEEWENMLDYMKEVLLVGCAVSYQHVPTAESNRKGFVAMVNSSRAPALMVAVMQLKELIQTCGSQRARTLARVNGLAEKDRWSVAAQMGVPRGQKLTDQGEMTQFLSTQLGPLQVKVAQECAIVGSGEVRFALGKSDMERLHQLVMSATSALVGVCSQAAVGTELQKVKARRAVDIADANISRIVRTARLVPLGDEVLVCKAYRRAYTAHLGWLAGPLCREETKVLVQEAEETAAPGVVDVEGFLADARSLDAASSLNAAKMFKICPAPDVSPATAMMDRIAQIGDGNVVDPEMMPIFQAELRTQILRAHIRSHDGRLKLRPGVAKPSWFSDYLQGEMDKVPSDDIHRCLAWEGSATMPDISRYDPTHWKDSGLGADSIWESEAKPYLGYKSNMLTRLIFDEECPMPGRPLLSEDHVIKFFVKAEGHKDPARGIFSANLTDRQAQSWMEKAVESVAKKHPSFMIGQEADTREVKQGELTARPSQIDWMALYYSFDISGWSAKMPAEPQRISHDLWAELFGGHLFSRATAVNEGAHIYMNLDGYRGWFKNTHSNLEGFNGKEMTMILIALLSLSVKRWRVAVVEEKLLSREMANTTTALLFAYIDDGLSRIDLPRDVALGAFELYKRTVIETFKRCGFTVEVSKCFPSDRFAIFLNEVYIGGRHVVHGVRAAMGISSEPTERHTSLIERVTSVSTGVRGAVMAGLNPQSALMLMSYHVYLHLMEWVTEKDPAILGIWSMCPRSWGGLGLPNALQLFVSGSGAAFEEGAATMQGYAKISLSAKRFFLNMCRTKLEERSATGVLTAPLSSRVEEGYMNDNRVSIAVRKALGDKMDDGRVSTYAARLLKYANSAYFEDYAEAIVALGYTEVVQEQMLLDLREAHPHSIFSAFARRLEKASTVMSIVGWEEFQRLVATNRTEAVRSVACVRKVLDRPLWSE